MMKILKLSWNKVKKERSMFIKEYEELKAKMGYESADCSSASSPSEDEEC